MRKSLYLLLSLAICHSTFAQEMCEVRKPRKSQSAGYASRDATVFSMMAWGVAIAIGIATFCAMCDNDITTSTSQ